MIDAKNIPESVQKTIITKIAEMKERDTTTISLESNLILDIFLDSLDAAELKAFVQAQFKGASNPPITDLKTVGDLCMMAIGRSGSNEELKPCDWKLPEDSETTLHEIIKNHSEKYGDSASILTHFKEAFRQNSNEGFVYDILF
jgi:acyl carrier protein